MANQSTDITANGAIVGPPTPQRPLTARASGLSYRVGSWRTDELGKAAMRDPSSAHHQGAPLAMFAGR